MNLRQIIRESINSVILDSIISEAIGNTVGNQQPTINFSQFADELRKLVGNSGIDAKPVQNNQAALQHIDTLNHFVFYVIDAIDNGNIDAASSPATGNRHNNKWSNPYGKDNVDIARDAMRGSVNYLGNGAENLLGRGTNNPLNGVFKAGVDAYNNTNSAFTQLMNNRERANAYGDKPEIVTSGSLADLMKIYPDLFSQYQQINQQSNNIFSATPNVGNCYTVLQNLHTAFANYQNSKGQQTQNGQGQPNGGQPNSGNSQPNGGQPNGGQPNGGNTQPNSGNGQPNGGQPSGGFNPKPSGKKINFSPTNDPTYRPNYSKYVNELNGKGDKIADIVEGIENKTSDSNVVNILQWIGNLSDNVVSAIQNGSYYKEDYQNTRIEPLTKLMSLDGSKTGEEGTYEWVFWTYQKLHGIYERMPESNEFKALNEKDVVYTIQSLRFLYTQMKRDKIVDKPKKNNR